MATTMLSNIGNLLYPGIAELFNRAVKRARVLQYKPIVREKSLKNLYGYYDTMGNLGPAQIHSEGNAINYDRIEHNNRTTLTSQVVVKGVRGTMESMHFDLYD